MLCGFVSAGIPRGAIYEQYTTLATTTNALEGKLRCCVRNKKREKKSAIPFYVIYTCVCVYTYTSCSFILTLPACKKKKKRVALIDMHFQLLPLLMVATEKEKEKP